MNNQRVAIITGASRGIGNAIAVRLAEEGYAIVAVGTSQFSNIAENLQKIKNVHKDFIYIRKDISIEYERKEILKETLEKFGRVDVLVNNAGVAPKMRNDILMMPEESMDYVFNINIKGTFFLTQLIANEMISEIEQGVTCNPVIINLSSISAYTSSTKRGEYCMAKASVSMMTQLFADRLAEYGIYVHEIRPGIIQTEMISAVKEKYDTLVKDGLIPIKRLGTPEDVADAAALLCSGRLSYTTGQVINVDGGFHIRRL